MSGRKRDELRGLCVRERSTERKEVYEQHTNVESAQMEENESVE